MILALVLIPAGAGVLAFFLRSTALRRWLLVATALTHGLLTVGCWWHSPAPILGNWLALDKTGLLFLSVTSTLFVAASIYGLGYLRVESHAHATQDEEGFVFTNAPEATFIGCLLLFLAAMSLVVLSQHLGLLWIAVEGTTLASAPLIYFHRHHHSLEATWKYLLICSVGIALALLGNFFLGVAAARPGQTGPAMVVAELVQQAGSLQAPWLKAAFILFLVGYGTKMGLAPLHTWLPDAHSEAPSVISALLSGALLNCAFLGILRVQQVCAAAGLASFSQELLLGLGLFSMGVAAVFIVGQTDYKRLLAYSSVEHVGILAFGVGLGGAGTFGALLHAVSHSLTKAILFFVAGNLLAVYRTKTIAEVRGVWRAMPRSGLLWVVGFLAITGSPPFGPFLSEFTILKSALDQGATLLAVLYLAMLAFIFIGMATAFLNMAQGPTAQTALETQAGEGFLRTAPPAFLGALVLGLGLYIPAALAQVLHEAARSLGGS